MKIMLLEPDKDLANSLDTYINSLRLKMHVKKLTSETELLQEKGLKTYSLFVLNLQDPLSPNILKFIRNNGGIAPVLLILEKNPDLNPFTISVMTASL